MRSLQDRELSGAAALPAGRSSRPKRSRQQREAELTRLALAPESPAVRERREQALAQSFFQRVKVGHGGTAGHSDGAGLGVKLAAGMLRFMNAVTWQGREGVVFFLEVFTCIFYQQ